MKLSLHPPSTLLLQVGTSTWMQYLMNVGFPGVLQNSTHWHYTAEKYLKPPEKRWG